MTHLGATRHDPHAPLAALAKRVEKLEQALASAQTTIALLNDRLAWAEAELAAQASPFAPVATPAPWRAEA